MVLLGEGQAVVSLTDHSGDSWALWPDWGPGPICSPTGSEQNDPVPRGLPWSLSSCLTPHPHPGHRMLEAKRAMSLLLQPSSL